VRDRERRLRDEVRAPFGSTVLRLDTEDSQRIVAMARRRPGTHNARRRFVEQQVSSLLAEQYRAFREQADEWSGYIPAAQLADAEGPGDDREALDADGAVVADNELDLVDIGRQIRRLPEIAAALNRMWPRLAPHELVHDLLGARPLLASAGRGILTDAEQAALFRGRSAGLDAVAWTPADVALIDEARTLLGPRQPRPTRAEARERDVRRPDAQAWPKGLGAAATGPAPQNPSDEIRSFGHIVVDEAQDLSPMQFRMVARRAPSGSLTILGDLAQATGAWNYHHWDEILAHLPSSAPVRRDELTLGYRAPGQVLDLASKLLAVSAPMVTPTRSIRRGRHEPRIIRVEPDHLLARSLDEAVRLAGEGFLVGLVVAPGHLGAMTDLARDRTDVGILERDGIARPVTLVGATATKGLEFDAVAVVEPSAIAGTELRGLRLLYVAMTRPIRHLSIVHSEPLPDALTG
jgi:hypothetical protein